MSLKVYGGFLLETRSFDRVWLTQIYYSKGQTLTALLTIISPASNNPWLLSDWMKSQITEYILFKTFIISIGLIKEKYLKTNEQSS